MRRFLARMTMAFLTLGAAASQAAPEPAASAGTSETAYLFSYFINNGEDGLHLAWSDDGLKWQALNDGKSYLKPAVGAKPLMRDPCLLRGPDGTFHLVWTTSWGEKWIGHATSRDLVNWSEQQKIPVMAHEPSALNSWAPEIAYDAVKRRFLLFWSSTIPGRFPATEGKGDEKYNHRIYCTTTADFRDFTPTRLFYDDGFNVIDATLLRAGGRFHLIVKDETKNPVQKNLRMATGDAIDGPYSAATPPFTPAWVEGPSALTIGGDHIVYFDCYTKHHYGAVKSRDLKTWEDITPQIAFPAGTRHGTAIAVPRAIVDRLKGGVKDLHVATTPMQRTDEDGRDRFEQINERTRGTKPAIIFLGDSITQHWEWDQAGEKAWKKYWLPLGAANFGVAADRTEHVLWRIDQGQLDGMNPKVIVLEIGTNNTGEQFENEQYKCTAAQTADGIRAIIDRLRQKCPAAKILVMAIFPRGETADDAGRKQNEATNALIKDVADGKGVFFMDIGDKLVKPNRDGDVTIMPDMLHLSPKGYEIWSRAIAPLIKQLL